MEKLHHESQTFAVHSNPGCHHNGVLPALGTATSSHSISACPVGLTDLDSNHDAYLHAYQGTHRHADGDLYTPTHQGTHRYADHDLYTHTHQGAHRYANDDLYAHACRGAHHRGLH